MPNLCAGSYTDIKATIGKQTAISKPVSLVAPNLVIDRIASEQPTAPGKCDGAITFYGLQAGQKAKVTYSLNGVKRSGSYTVAPDNSLGLSGLCEGTITDISIESNKCVAQLSNHDAIVLAGPKPAPVAEVPAPEVEDPSSQILFDFNTADLRPSSYAVIDRVFVQMQKDRASTVVIDGNTDEIGTDAYNQKLSDRRAAAVRAYLIKRGIASSRIKDHGNGEREPVATNKTAEGRSKNRRAELVLKIK